MSRPARRGEIWTVDGYPLPILVISGNMYNEQPSIPTVLAMPVVTSESELEGWTAPLDQGQYAIVDRIAPYRKNDLTQPARDVSVQALTETNNLLFKILSTN